MSMGAGPTVDGDGVMRGASDAKFGEKRRSRKLVVGDNKGNAANGKERRGGGEGRTLDGGRGDGNNSLTMDASFYQRDIL